VCVLVYVCVCVFVCVCVCVVAFGWFRFCWDGGMVFAGVFCECVVVLCSEVDCIFICLAIFCGDCVCFCFVVL